MRKSIVSIVDEHKHLRLLLAAICGCLMITLGSLLRIPCYPVPFTCQSLAIFIIGLTYSPKEAIAAAVCYLVCATAGLPVLDGKANPFWMYGKCAGYLFSFPLAAYLIATLHQKMSSVLALFCGNVCILFCGWLGLIPFLGPKMALIQGVLVFIPSGIAKIFLSQILIKKRFL